MARGTKNSKKTDNPETVAPLTTEESTQMEEHEITDFDLNDVNFDSPLLGLPEPPTQASPPIDSLAACLHSFSSRIASLEASYNNLWEKITYIETSMREEFAATVARIRVLEERFSRQDDAASVANPVEQELQNRISEISARQERQAMRFNNLVMSLQDAGR